jgi:microcompartment protein CcmK/EutM
MARSNLQDLWADGVMLRSGNKMGVAVYTATGNIVMGPGMDQVQMIDTGGSARNLRLPASPKRGDYLWILNISSAANSITVQDSAGAGLTSATVIAQGKGALVVYSGDATIGWRSVMGA